MNITHESSAGVYFVATGTRYLKAAHEAAQNVKKHCPYIRMAVATDLIGDVDPELFEHVIEIKDAHRRSKVDLMHQSPFDRTLYLDSDVRVLEDISHLFQILDRFDIAIAHAHNRNADRTLETWREPIPKAFPQLNAGIILFQMNEKVRTVLRDWSTAYSEGGFRKDQVTLRELLWQSDLRLYVLPPEFNIRHSRLIDYWTKEEAKPQILHMALYNDVGEKRSAVLRRRVKEVLADLATCWRVLRGTIGKLVRLGNYDRSKNY